MSHAKLRTTRKQLADFLKDPDSIDTFERLVSIVDGLKDGSPLGAGWDAALTAALGAGWDAALTAALGAGWIATLAATVVGVIVESGSNSNGSYIKFSDGTMECWGWDSIQWSSGVSYVSKTINLPHAFTEIRSIQSTCAGSKSTAPTTILDTVALTAVWGTSRPLTLSSFTETLSYAVGIASTSYYLFMWTAIGRWK